MRILSVLPGTFQAMVPGTRPMVMAMQEVVFPPKVVLLPQGEVVTVAEAEGTVILKRYGKAGIVAVPDGMPDSEIPDLLVRVKEQRYQHLGQILINYRNEQAARQASGVPIALPGPHLRQLVKEMRSLKQELLSADPVLTEEFAGLKDEGAVPADPMAEELRDFGITEKAAPMTPGVTMADLPL